MTSDTQDIYRDQAQIDSPKIPLPVEDLAVLGVDN
jgi:hypothetical protein